MRLARSAVAVSFCLLIFGAVGCSNDNDGVTGAAVGASVEPIMQFVLDFFATIDPTAPGPAVDAAVLLGSCPVIPNNDLVCPEGGQVQDCTNNTFEIVECQSTDPLLGPIHMDGLITFDAQTNWPTGDADLTPGGTSSYEMAFDGTNTATVNVIDGALLATCTVDLDTVEADCQIVEPSVF